MALNKITILPEVSYWQQEQRAAPVEYLTALLVFVVKAWKTKTSMDSEGSFSVSFSPRWGRPCCRGHCLTFTWLIAAWRRRHRECVSVAPGWDRTPTDGIGGINLKPQHLHLYPVLHERVYMYNRYVFISPLWIWWCVLSLLHARHQQLIKATINRPHTPPITGY